MGGDPCNNCRMSPSRFVSELLEVKDESSSMMMEGGGGGEV